MDHSVKLVVKKECYLMTLEDTNSFGKLNYLAITKPAISCGVELCKSRFGGSQASSLVGCYTDFALSQELSRLSSLL